MRLNRVDHLFILSKAPERAYRSCVEVRLAALAAYYVDAKHKYLDDEDEEQIAALAAARYPGLTYDDLTAPRSDGPTPHPKVLQAEKVAEALRAEKRERDALREEKVRELKTKPIYLADGFWNHIFLGENHSGNGAHTGLHSIALLSVSSSGYPKIDKDAADSNGCYEATVKLRDKKATKWGSFFPDNWNQDTVKQKVMEAIYDSWVHPNEYTRMKAQAGLTWVGAVTGPAGVVYIGGLGGSGKTPAERVATAFPSVNGKFTPPPKGNG